MVFPLNFISFSLQRDGSALRKAGLVQIRGFATAALAPEGTAACGRFGLTARGLVLVGLTGAAVPYAPVANAEVGIFVAVDCCLGLAVPRFGLTARCLGCLGLVDVEVFPDEGDVLPSTGIGASFISPRLGLTTRLGLLLTAPFVGLEATRLVGLLAPKGLGLAGNDDNQYWAGNGYSR